MALHHPNEESDNLWRDSLARLEPVSQRTFTPSLAVISHSAGIYHWTGDGRRLIDLTSGVLVANLGHNPARWMRSFRDHMNWPGSPNAVDAVDGYFPCVPLTAYNALTPIEVSASSDLIGLVRSSVNGWRLERVLWAASGSEAIQKALWACQAYDRDRPLIIATRYGFHGKKGLANAVTGCETDPERDPRVQFISFPMAECRDVSMRDEPFDVAPYRSELDALYAQHGKHLGTLITEPYLGGGGSYHPPAPYLQMLEAFCREHNILFILDEVQSNFGRTRNLFAFEAYDLSPDLVVLGKGLGNGVPVAAVIGRSDVLDALRYGEASDTWSGNPLACAAVRATLEEYLTPNRFPDFAQVSEILERGLVALKKHPFVAHVRGEAGGMVWGVEMADFAGRTGAEWAAEVVLACYRGAGREGIHILGPLAKRVLRVAPPLVMTPTQARETIDLLHSLIAQMAEVHV